MAWGDLNFPEDVLETIHKLDGAVMHTISPNVNTDLTPVDPHALGLGALGDAASQITHIGLDIKTAYELLVTQMNKGLLDDRKYYLLENIIKIASSLPDDSPLLAKLNNFFIENLWDNLDHPPLTYLGDEWRFRMPDGSNNNRMYPQLGKAGSPYARTVTPKVELPPSLPHPGLIFDELMDRGNDFKEHPNKMSSMLFYLASIIIHDVFRTNEKDYNIVDNDSYLDLGPLYGHSRYDQESIRQMKDGLLKPDTFWEPRLLGFPPGVPALMICFNRFHNYVAQNLAIINEGGRFDLKYQYDGDDDKEEARKRAEKKRDEDLFQTARLVTCGLYVNIILYDYVGAILNLNETNSTWTLDPRENTVKIYGPSGIPEGIGNQVSVEFNLVYRWHSAVSQSDAEWSEQAFARILNGKDPNKIDITEFKKLLKDFLKDLPKDPSQWTFNGFKRETDGPRQGLFKDSDLVNLLSDKTEDVAGAFGARNVPTILRLVEMLGIEQARSWNVATLNEFRNFFGMVSHAKFTDISSNPKVASSLEALYGSPDLVELYPGLVAEDAKEVDVPGSGLCPGYTISKAILADAVALVRGDRFYTVDYTAATLTNWGYTEVASNPLVARGGVIYKLLMAAFPRWYQGNSIYAMFPFSIPSKNKEVMKKLGKLDQYDFSRPSYQPYPTQIFTWEASTKVLADKTNFAVPWGPHTYAVTHHDYMLSNDGHQHEVQKPFVMNSLYGPNKSFKPEKALQEIGAFYEKITTNLVKERSAKMHTSYQIDAVADIANLSHSIATATMFHVPLKLPDHDIGLFTAQEFYTINALMFAYVFLDLDPSTDVLLKTGAEQAIGALGKVYEKIVALVQDNPILDEISDAAKKLSSWFHHGIAKTVEDSVPDYGTHWIQRLSEGGKSAEEVTWSIIPTMAAMVATQAQGISQTLDILLSDEYKHHWADIEKLARSKDPAAIEKLERYGLEAYRLNPPAFGLFRNVNSDQTIQDGDRTLKLDKGSSVYTNFVTACLDPTAFPDPHEIKLDRPLDKYIHQGWGPHHCAGRDFVRRSMGTQLQVLGKLKNLRKAPGPQGHMKYQTLEEPLPVGVKVYMKADWTAWWPFPTTMKLLHDGFVEE